LGVIVASIQVHGKHASATMHGPDEDGDYGWTCVCGTRDESYQPIADAIADAEVHVDIQCQSESEN
jgi:hypothetical protein